jgi:hypothetical protein
MEQNYSLSTEEISIKTKEKESILPRNFFLKKWCQFSHSWKRQSTVNQRVLLGEYYKDVPKRGTAWHRLLFRKDRIPRLMRCKDLQTGESGILNV